MQSACHISDNAAGQHVLVVRELFPSHLLTSGQLRQRRLMQQRELGKAYKAIVVEVKPDKLVSTTTYLPGATTGKL